MIYETKVDRKLCNKPINMCNTDERLFASNLPQDMTTQYVNVDDFTNDVTNALYDCAATSRCVQDVQNVDSNLGRWERLMEDKDDA